MIKLDALDALFGNFMFEINNRRYLGSKYKLLSFIQEIVEKHSSNCKSFMDLFGGTGVVASHFNHRFDVIVNDILKSNVFVYKTFLSSEHIDTKKLEEIISAYNGIDITNHSENYYSENFADTFLSKDNMKRVGIIRDDINQRFANGEINEREQAILVTSLIYAIDKIANTVGHYDAFRRLGDLSRILKLDMPLLLDKDNTNNSINNLDANELVKQVSSDIVYIDPPYNSRQYCDAYHFLENVAENKKPEVKGVAKKMDRSHLKSNYCTNKAALQFRDLIQNIKAKYIIVSYNNTGEKINSRSNAKISDTEIIEILKSKGRLFIYEKDFNAFTTGKTNLSEHKERLFVCEVGIEEKNTISNKSKKSDDFIIKSPLNYTGGKAKLLPQIKDKLPKKMTVFYDIFSGGANVGVNIESESVFCIDKNESLINLMNYIKSSSYDELICILEDKINYYNLSDSFRNGYEFYGCNSSNGLGKYNKQGFNKLKQDYNKSKDNVLFLLLIIFGFNNQIRFNRKGDFNLPVGKRDFNSSLRKKLRLFIERIKNKNIYFICKDFRQLDIKALAKDNAFLYLDPPYILGTATYNENGGWTEEDEMDLLSFLKKCDVEGIKFALSNVMVHKGDTHDLLLQWCLDNSFSIHYLMHSYNNANYQKKNKFLETKEVLVTNY